MTVAEPLGQCCSTRGHQRSGANPPTAEQAFHMDAHSDAQAVLHHIIPTSFQSLRSNCIMKHHFAAVSFREVALDPDHFWPLRDACSTGIWEHPNRYWQLFPTVPFPVAVKPHRDAATSSAPDMVYCDTAAGRDGLERPPGNRTAERTDGSWEARVSGIKHPCPALRRAVQSYLTTGTG